jgi:trigger factor
VKVTRDKTENSQVFLTIEMDPAEVDGSLESSYHRLVKRVSVPGFRKGKAPRAVLERHIGRESLLDDALDNLLPQACEKAITEQEIEPIAQPQIEIVQTDPVVFKATVSIKPTVELGDYRQIQVERQSVEVAESDVDAAMEELRQQYATWEPVERPVQFDDLVTFDIESSIDGEPFINKKETQYQVIHDLPFPAPGFAEQLTGLGPGEEKRFSLQFPSDYPKDELKGKEASFTVRITEMKEKKLPELNDEFAGVVSPDFRAEEGARVNFEERVVQAVVDISQVEFPPVLVEMEINRLLDRQSRRLQMGGLKMEEYLTQVNKTEEELREELRPLAVQRVTQSLVLDRVADQEKFEVGDTEIDDEIENIVKGATEDKEELRKFLETSQTRPLIEQQLMTQKTIQRLMEMAESQKGGDA